MCILVFSSFSAEISELKDEKARMHNVHPGSHPLSSSRLAGLLPGWLEFLPGWLESLPGWLDSLSGWLKSLPVWLESLPGWLDSFLAGWSLS